MSGPGRIVVFDRGAGMVRARLSNFDIGQTRLKGQHASWLTANAVPILSAGGSLRIIGLASRSGGPALNHGLTIGRRGAVLAFLRSAVGRDFKVTLSEANGELAARLAGIDDGVEDERWRSVILSVWDRPTPPPIPHPPPVQAHPISRISLVTLQLSERLNHAGMSAQDRRAENWAAAGRALGQALDLPGQRYDLVASRHVSVPDNFNCTEIELARRNVTTQAMAGFFGRLIAGSEEHRYLDVTYRWTPGRTSRLINRIGRRDNPDITTLTADQVSDWLDRPETAYRRMNPGSVFSN